MRISGFAVSRDGFSVSRNGCSGSRNGISALIAAARSIFRNEIDKLMTKFRKTNLSFCNGNFAARVIVDRAATHGRKKAPPATPGA